MKKLIAISSILLSFSSSANVCELKEGSFDKAIRINGLPGFFFKVKPDGKYIAFIENGNQLLDIETGTSVKLQGEVDPVWSPDGKLLTHPGFDSPGMAIHDSEIAIAAALRGSPDDSRGFSDARLDGVYQSIGKQGDVYSIITDMNGASIGRYKIEDGKVKTVGDVSKFCSNIPDFSSNLPMISKDGKFISIYDGTSRSTKIYSLKGNDCALSVDLGFPTGKVSFNADSSQITFHLDQFGEFDDGWFSGISKDKVKNVVTLKLSKSGETLIPGDWALVSRAVTVGDGGYYPDYDALGNIYYLEDKNNFFQFVKVRQDQLEWFPFNSSMFRTSGDCSNCQEKVQRSGMEILASIWSDVCKNANIDLKNSPIHISAVDPEKCIKLVNDFWTPSLGITKPELLKSCPKKAQETGRIVGEWDLSQVRTAEAFFQARCTTCHTRDFSFKTRETFMIETGPETNVSGPTFELIKFIPKFDLETNEAKTLNRMIDSINANVMPKDNPLSEDERKMMVLFLQRKLLDLPENSVSSSWWSVIRKYTPENLAAELQSQLDQNPGGTQEYKEKVTRMVNCFYGNINCETYLIELKQELENLPEEEREEQLMTFRCSVMTDITPQECYDYYETKK